MRNQRDVQSVRKVLNTKFKTHLKGIKEELRKLLENWELRIASEHLSVTPYQANLGPEYNKKRRVFPILCDPYTAGLALADATKYYDSISEQLNNPSDDNN
jgi:hypothetical protein